MCSPVFRSIGLLMGLIVALCLSGNRVDDDFIKRLLDQFRIYHQQRPTEKAYVHTDRDAYLTGETIWLKGYLVNGTTHEVDTVSRVLYVDLVDPVAKRVRLRMQLRTTGGYAPGQLTLPDSLPSGTYQLRAYTSFMRNYPDAYFFTKTLTILRPDGVEPTTKQVEKSGTALRPDVQFLPEGGQLVDGIVGRIAFKAINASGQSLSVSGFVLDAKKDTVIGFVSTHLGMGYFTMKPEENQTYTAFVRLGNGALASYSMPAVQAQGIVMQVDNVSRKDAIRVYVQHNKTSADSAATLTLVAQTRGRIIQVAKIAMAKKMAAV